MLRRIVAVAAILAALSTITAGIAGAALIQVRVEGKTSTIFGPLEPQLDATNAMEALQAAATRDGFTVNVADSSFGKYVDEVAGRKSGGATGWVFKVNGVSPPVGADKVKLKDGDTVVWYFATFGKSGGPKTLQLSAAEEGCYAVKALDDKGKATAPAGAVLRVDGRSVPVKAGVGCPGAHKGLVRAWAPGAVRSNALR
jgi:hypothetical protein